MLVNGFQGFVPINFLMKCQRLKDTGGGSAKGMFEAMMVAVECYLPREDSLSKLACLVAEGVSVNFGEISVALTTIAELAEWAVLMIHCLNHRLKFVMKDAYQEEQNFVKLKGILDTLFQLFKLSGKKWTLYQTIATSLCLVTLQFTKVSGTRFQAHVLTALNFF